MKKDNKIKRYSRRRGFAPRPHKRPWRVIVTILGLVALVFIGVSSYKPVISFFQGKFEANPIPEIEQSSEPEVVSSEPESQIESQPEPDPEPVVEVATLHNPLVTRYLPLDIAQDEVALAEFLANLEPRYNSILVDTKTNQGVVTYNTGNEQAIAWGAVAEAPFDLQRLATTVKEKNLQLVVKMSVFSDPIAARGDMSNNAILHNSGVIWIDNTLANGGKPWTSAKSNFAQAYNLALAEEMSNIGADLIILDHVQVPNDPTGSALLGGNGEESITDALTRFTTQLKERVPNSRVGLYLTYGSALLDEGMKTALYGGEPVNLMNDIAVIDMSGLYLFDENSKVTTEVTEALAPIREKATQLIYVVRAEQITNPDAVEESYILFE